MQDLYDAIERELSIILTERERMIAARATSLMNKVNSDVVIRPVDFYIKILTEWHYSGEAERLYKKRVELAKKFDIEVDYIRLTDRSMGENKYKYIFQGRKKDVKSVLKMI